MRKFTIFCNQENKQKYIKQIENTNQKFVYDEENFEFIFAFGGDKIFLNVLHQFYNQDKKIILVKTGRVGFLSSTNNIDEIDLNENNFQEFQYLSINNKLIAINEIVFNSLKINEMSLNVDEIFFKKILCSKIMIINNLGTTAIARSYRYPIIFRNNKQYILDFLEEPMYHYYKPLNQPILLNNKSSIKFKEEIEFNVKYDGQNMVLKCNNLEIELKKSQSKILNMENLKMFFQKIDTNF